MSIKRYDLWSSGFAPENGEMTQADNGEYVLFDDHKATIATLTAERDQLGRVYLEVCQDAVNAHDTIDQLRKELAEAKAVVEDAGKVMALLEKYGKDIVPHLMDTDDNPGERIRRALAAQEASHDKR